MLVLAWDNEMPLIAALNLLQNGARVRRAGWTRYLVYSRGSRDEGLRYWLVVGPREQLLWQPSPEDLVATDYQLLE